MNSTAPYSPYLAMNQMNNAILKTFTNSGAYIKSNIIPLGLTKRILSFEEIINSFLAAVLLPLGLSFIPASLVVFTV
jgi:hypothetical protein